MENGETPLILAVGFNYSEIVDEIIEHYLADPIEGASFVEEYLESVANERDRTNLDSVMKSIVDGILPLDILQILLFCLSIENIIELHMYINSLYNDMSSCSAICYEEHPDDSVLSNIGQGYNGPLKQLVIDYLMPNSNSICLINKFKFILDDTFDQKVEIDLEGMKK
jgi:hypothetical protein